MALKNPPPIETTTGNPPSPGNSSYTWEWPVDTTVISGYGYGASHHALDIGARSGSKLFAPTVGKVLFAGWNNEGYGNLIIIQAYNGDRIYMAHLSEIDVKTGMEVTTGETIGKTGSTGNSSGPHLHFEIRTPGGGGWINPYDIFGKNPQPGKEITPAPGGAQPTGGNGKTSSGSVNSKVSNVMGDITGIGDAVQRLTDWFRNIKWGNVGVAAFGIVVVLIGVYGLVAGESAHIMSGSKSSLGL